MARRPAAIRISLLGPPRVERAGRPVSFDTRKALAVVAFLALEGPQSRERLAAVLWSDADQERARGALRRTLSVLRTGALGDDLRADGLSVALSEAVDVDVARFRDLLARGRLDDAAAAYTGDLLAGFSLRDAPEFEAWHAREAETLRRELAGALERLAQDARDPARAIAHARRWLELDPLHEPAYRALMRLHARVGDRAAALRHYRECVRVLDQELGVTPMRETAALASAIERGEPEPDPEPPVPAALSADETVGDVYTHHGDYARAIASYEAALRGATAREQARVEHKLADVHHRRGDWDQAEEHYRRALRGEDDPARRARVTADRGLVAHRRGDRIRATRLAEEALTLARRARDDRALAQAHNILGILTGERRHLAESLAIAERIGDDAARVAALNNLALALARADEVAEAIALTERALALASALGDRHREAALHNNLADLLHRAGRDRDAMRTLRRAVAIFSEIGERGAREPEVWKLVQW